MADEPQITRDEQVRKDEHNWTRVFVCAASIVVFMWLATPLLFLWWWPADLEKSGQAGDLFGAINALFSGLAFAGIIVALLMQRSELNLQREELAATRKELKRTAKAQRLAADTARRALEVVERPYVYIWGATQITYGEDEGDGSYGFIKYSVANYGKTPAIIESVDVGVSVAPAPIEPATAQGHQFASLPILIPNDKREGLGYVVPDSFALADYSAEDTPPGYCMEPILEDGTAFYFWVRIKYHGPFSTGHQTDAIWQYNDGGLVKYERDVFK